MKLTAAPSEGIALLELFPDGQKPCLLFQDEQASYASVFEGDIQLDPLPTRLTPLVTTTNALIVIRQKIYPKAALDRHQLDSTPATAVIEYVFNRRTTESVTPLRINVYRPEQQIGIGTRLSFLTSSLLAMALQNRLSGSPRYVDGVTVGDSWIPRNNRTHIQNFPIVQAASVALLAAVVPHTALTVQQITTSLPPNWSDWGWHLLPSLPELAHQGLVSAVKQIPGLYVIQGAGSIFLGGWLYFKAVDSSAYRTEFQKAMAVYAMLNETYREKRIRPHSVSPGLSALSRSKAKRSVDTETRTRQSYYQMPSSGGRSGTGHGNRSMVYLADGLRYRGK